MKYYPLWKSIIVFSVVFLAIVFSVPSFIYDENKNIRGDIANDLCKKIVFDLGSYSSIAKLINDANKSYPSKDNSLSIDKIMRKAGCLK